MDLTARVTALEEEVNLLKGEIKSILQEVRVAVLARENPFLNGTDSQQATPAPAYVAPEPPSHVPATPQQAAPAPAPEVAHIAEAVISQQAVTRTRETGNGHEGMVLATLMSWLQDTAQQFSHADMTTLLALSRHGGLIDAGLEETLSELASAISTHETAHKASVSEFLVAVRQLEAIQGVDFSRAKSANQTEPRPRRAA